VPSPAREKSGLLWLVSLLLGAWSGESRFGLSKLRKPTAKWGELPEAHAQRHFVALFYVMA